MIRVYQETFSKGNQCFLRAETTIHNRSIQAEMESRIKLYEEGDSSYTIVDKNDNFVIIKEDDIDFITIITISDLEAK